MDRAPEPGDGDERALLLGWLNFHRDALAAKCAALTDDQLVTTSAPPSTLSLLGLVRHLTEMERHYLVDAISGRKQGLIYCTDDDPEQSADALIAQCADLSEPAASGWGSVRRHVLKVLQEYARHNGHADIVRERIDGSRGE
jgi:hypothetical protein